MTEEEAERFGRDLDRLAPYGRIAVAVSGGPDSLALLLLAQAVRPGAVIAATVDHGLRADSAAEAHAVAEACARRGVPHTTLAIKVPDDRTGLQAAARAARYAALGRWAADGGAAWLATGHHRDDQAETVLMRAARGAGVAGLSGIRQSRSLNEAPGITLIRPLLRWTKAELEAVVAGSGLAPARDPSNDDPRFDRTRARALLAQGWPAADRLVAVAARMAEAEAALAWSAQALAEERLAFADGAARLDVEAVPREYRRRLLLMIFAVLVPEARLRGDSLDRLLAALERGEVATLAGLRCEPGSQWRFAPAAPRRAG